MDELDEEASEPAANSAIEFRSERAFGLEESAQCHTDPKLAVTEISQEPDQPSQQSLTDSWDRVSSKMEIQSFRLDLSDHFYPYFNLYSQGVCLKKQNERMPDFIRESMSVLSEKLKELTRLSKVKTNDEISQQSQKSLIIQCLGEFKSLIKDYVYLYYHLQMKKKDSDDLQIALCENYEILLKNQIDDASIATLNGLRFPVEHVKEFNHFLNAFKDLISDKTKRQEIDELMSPFSKKLNEALYNVNWHEGKIGMAGQTWYWVGLGDNYLASELASCREEKDPSEFLRRQESLERRLSF